MKISQVEINGFRNFKSTTVNFQHKALIMGGNDVGKTNLIYALRLLLDRNIPDSQLMPTDADFFVNRNDGKKEEKFNILIKFDEVKEDSLLSILKNNVSDGSEFYANFIGERIPNINYQIQIGPSKLLLENIENNYRFYLKYLNLRFVKTNRDLIEFIRYEKKYLLKSAIRQCNKDELDHDRKIISEIEDLLHQTDNKIQELNYIKLATETVNEEMGKISQNNIELIFDPGTIDTNEYIENLELTSKFGAQRLILGGDGKNNQIQIALWKAKSEREIDTDNEVVIYCIEEPEAHLHPHQQRKLSKYLFENLLGQTIVTTHSPQIVAEFSPESIIRLYEKDYCSHAASNGCSAKIKDVWKNFGYRMSIIPAEAFFSNCVFLVEGSSEVLFYHKLAEFIKVDLDKLNISILEVGGIDFDVYIKILDAMEIPWVMRTDNDIVKVPNSNPIRYRFAGLLRAKNVLPSDISGIPPIPLIESTAYPEKFDLVKEFNKTSSNYGVFVSYEDLELDLIHSKIRKQMMKFADSEIETETVAYFKDRKATRMAEFLASGYANFLCLEKSDICKPLLLCAEKSRN